MADRVPYSPVPEQVARDLPAPFQNIEARPGAFGALVGQAIGRTGQTIEQGAEKFAAVQLEQQRLYDETYANESSVSIAQAQTKAYDELARRQGAAALHYIPQYQKQLEDNFKDAVSKAPNARTQAMIARQARYLTDHWLSTGQHYADQQFRTWQNKTADDKITSDGNQAVLAMNNPTAMETFLRGSDDGVRQKLENQGYDRATIKQEILKNRGKNYQRIIGMMLDDPDKGPVPAKQFYEAHEKEMDAASSVQILNKLKVGLGQVRGREIGDEVMNRGINGLVDKIATEEGIDPKMLRGLVKIESGANPNAVSGSYKGLGQLSDEEFRKHGGGDIFNPEHNLRATARKLANDSVNFAIKYGRAPTPADLYLIHQQGEGGYAAHMARPDLPAWQNMLSTAEGRQKGEAWAKAAIWGNVPDTMKARFGSVDNITSGQFVALWSGKIAAASGTLLPDKAEAFERIVAATRDNPTQQNAALAWMNHVYQVYSNGKQQQLATFQTRLQDSTTEALRNGAVKDPIAADEFYENLGLEKGYDAYREYQDKIQLGADVASVKGMTDVAQDQLLTQREPKPGMGFAEQNKRYEALHDTITQIREQRRSDPAGSVKDSDPVKAATMQARDGKPESFQALINTRLAAQEQLGIPEGERSPITRDEAEALTVPLTRMMPGEERKTLARVAENFKKLFGEHADEAFSYALRVHKMGAETSKVAANVLKKIAMGQQPTIQQARDMDVTQDLDAANEVIHGTPEATGDEFTMQREAGANAPPPPPSGAPGPAIRALRAYPQQLKGQFIKEYGQAEYDRIMREFPAGPQ